MTMPGSLITRNGQAEIRGLLIGSGTPYAVEGWSGLGLPEIRDDDAELEGDDGSSGGLDLYATRSISATIGISADDRDALGAARDLLAAAFRRVDGPRQTVPFVVRLAGTSRRFEVRPRRLELPWEGVARVGMMVGGAFRLDALDPYAYAVDETSETIEIPDTSTTASAVLTNAGNGRTRPVVTITGPATDPVVANLETGLAIRTSIVLGSSDVLVVDVAAARMTLNGSPVWAGASDYEPMELVPGAQEIAFSRATDSIPATAQIVWRDAWQAL